MVQFLKKLKLCTNCRTTSIPMKSLFLTSCISPSKVFSITERHIDGSLVKLCLKILLVFVRLILLIFLFCHCPADIYMLEVNSRNTRKRCEICSKLTAKIPERRQWLKASKCRLGIDNQHHKWRSWSSAFHKTISFPTNYHATILSLLTYFDFDSVLSHMVWV